MRNNIDQNGGTGKLLPVLFGFFVMGFCDVVGISTSYVKIDFNLSETLAGFIPSMVFVWFLLLSVPTAIIMNKIGRKNTVQISNVITIAGMMIPFFSYNFATCMIAFAMLGIGNAMLQVSLNPLLTNVIKGDRLTSSLTAGQVIKAVSSFCGPFIAAFAVSFLGNWKALFPIFAVVTALAALWLLLTPIQENKATEKSASLGNTFALLKDRTILFLFLGIVAVVGIDVGSNTLAPKLLMDRCSLDVATAGFGSSVYFLCRTVGAFIGAILLVKMSDFKYFRIHIIIALVAVSVLLFVEGKIGILVSMGVIGYSISSIFAIIYSLALKHRPDKANEISGLLITGVFGGAVTPPLMGLFTDALGSQTGSIIVLLIFVSYLVIFSLLKKSDTAKS